MTGEKTAGEAPTAEFSSADKNRAMTERELKSNIEEYGNMLYRLAYSYTGSCADSDDITEEAFIKLFYGRKSFRTEEEKKAWLIRVTVNLCKNRLSHWWRKKRADMPESEASAEADIYPELDEALQKLGPDYRAVIYLHYYEGYSVSEIGKLLGISVTAVTTRLSRGREKLRGMLEDKEE